MLLNKTDWSRLEASRPWPVWPVSDTPKPSQMTQNLILSIFSFLPQVKIPNGLEDMICLGFWVYFTHFLKKGVFFGFFCFLKTFLEFKYKFKGCNFLVSNWFEDPFLLLVFFFWGGDIFWKTGSFLVFENYQSVFGIYIWIE